MLWKKRWFVLSEYCLFYYKGQTSFSLYLVLLSLELRVLSFLSFLSVFFETTQDTIPNAK